jgi:hypothetical protein
MSKIKYLSGVMLLVVTLFIVAASVSQSADDKSVTVEGNIICLIPDYKSGNVKPVIAAGPCDKLPPHEHVLVTKTRVYYLQSLGKGLQKIELMPDRTDVKITGKVKETPSGWILYVD